MKAIRYDWFEFGVFGVFKADELPLHREELKKYGQKCTSVYFDKTKEEIYNIYNHVTDKQ